MATQPVAVDAADTAVDTPDPRAVPPRQAEGSVVSLTGHHALFAIDEIVRRLADRALLPSSQISQSERQLIDDVLAALLPKLDYGHRAMLCERFLSGTDVPRKTVALLARGDSDFSKELLEKSPVLCELDLIDLLHHGTEEQHIAIARRRDLSAPAMDAIAADGLSQLVTHELLTNKRVSIPAGVLGKLVARAKEEPELVDLILGRDELGPGLAFDMFWIATSEQRGVITKRFSIDRNALEFGTVPNMKDAIESLAPSTIAALEIIAGPQTASEFDAGGALEAIQNGHAEDFFSTVADGSGLSHALVKKIVADRSGEPLAILCKALRFGRSRFVIVLNLFQKAWGVGAEEKAQEKRLSMIYDTLSVDRADLILRYWNYAPNSLDEK